MRIGEHSALKAINPKMHLRKFETLARIYKWSHKKMYSGRIKATRGLQCLDQKDSKPLSHRIVRRKLQREMVKDMDL